MSALTSVPTTPAMRHAGRFLLAAALMAPVAARAQDRQSDAHAFSLDERVPQGAWIRVRNVNGGMRVTASNSDHVEVTATKRWRRGDPKDVTIDVKKGSDGSVLICAVWANTETTCTENSYSTHSHHDWDDHDRNDVAVDFDVRVPKGVKVGVWTVNGAVSVDGATSEVRASTVNGAVNATSSGGPVQAGTVNGSVHAVMGRFDSDQDLNYRTVNGSVIVEFTGDIDADLELSTVNGRFDTDWPVTITGRIDPRHLRVTLGKGGRRIRLETVNGNVELRKR